MYKKLREAEGEWNGKGVSFIKEVLNKMKKVIKNVSENKNLRLKKTKR